MRCTWARRLHRGGAVRALSRSGRGRGCWSAIAACVAAGALIGSLAFRFGISGVLLRAAHDRLRRVHAHRLRPLGLDRRLGRAVPEGRAARRRCDLLDLRGPPAMYYYVAARRSTARRLRPLQLAAAQPRRLLLAGDPRERGGRAGARHRHLPLEAARGRDQRGDDRARPACSSPSTTTTCFPSRSSTSAARSRSSSAPIIGGIGTLFGPVLGAAVLTLLVRGAQRGAARASAGTCPASSRCSTASCCSLMVMFLPNGIWPPLARALGL